VALNDDRIARFARQLLVPGFGEAAQERLLSARIRVVGGDGLATPALLHLALAGAGRLWVDDPDVVTPADAAGGWLYPPDAVGTPREEAAAEALGAASRFTAVDGYPAGGVPDAALVVAPSPAQALAAAEASRRAGVPHVVVEADGEGGVVVAVPPGAPCYACARSSGTGRPAEAGTAALAALAAQELVLLVANPAAHAGRRIELVRGVTTTRPTARLPGCACAPPPAAVAAGASPSGPPSAG
jgi:adenylyltransferase/sulfurtransferase